MLYLAVLHWNEVKYLMKFSSKDMNSDDELRSLNAIEKSNIRGARNQKLPVD